MSSPSFCIGILERSKVRASTKLPFERRGTSRGKFLSFFYVSPLPTGDKLSRALTYFACLTILEESEGLLVLYSVLMVAM